LLASLLVAVMGLRHALLLSVVPGLLAALSITLAAHHARTTLAEPVARRTLRLNLSELRRAGLARALAPVALFELGNLATTLLILRATTLLHDGSRSLTAATSLAVLMYAAHNGAAALAALAGGQLADRVTARTVFTAGAGLYVVAYATFAWEQHHWAPLLAAFLLSGAGIGLAETAESTVVAYLLPERLRSNGFGVLGLTQSIGDLGATLVVGVLWATVSPTVAFAYAACWMTGSVLTSVMLRPRAARTAG
jgi:MFS family permease